jgi:hypothetical protein
MQQKRASIHPVWAQQGNPHGRALFPGTMGTDTGLTTAKEHRINEQNASKEGGEAEK